IRCFKSSERYLFLHNENTGVQPNPQDGIGKIKKIKQNILGGQLAPFFNHMKEEIIEGWVKVYETYDHMLGNLIEARLNDEGIDFQVMNKADIGYTMEVGNNAMGRNATGLALKFFVQPADVQRVQEIVNEDRSNLLDNPDLDFDNTENQ